METRRKDTVSKVRFSNVKLLKPHETDHSNSVPEFPMCMEEIKRKLQAFDSILNSKNIGNEIWCNQKPSENAKRVTEELEKFIQCIFTTELLPYLQSYVADASFFIQLIFNHFLAKLAQSPREIDSEYQRNRDKDCFGNSWNSSDLKYYFDLYYEDIIPEVSFDLIHVEWKYHPGIEFILRLLCCKSLLENKHYVMLDQLMRNNEEYFFSVTQKTERDLAAYIFVQNENWTHLTLLLILVCNYVTSRQTEKVKTVLMHIKDIIAKSCAVFRSYSFIERMLNDFMLFTLWKKQMGLIPWLIKVLQPVLYRQKLHTFNFTIISICKERLLEVNCHKESMDFIKDNSHFILNTPFFVDEMNCHKRQKYCILLLTLLHAYVLCEDLKNMNHVLKRLQEFRHSLLNSTYEACACFMGKLDCNENESFDTSFSTIAYQHKKFKRTFIHASMAFTLKDFRNKFIKEKNRSVLYLKHTKDAGEKYVRHIYREDILEEFTLFIEQISLQIETGLYDIIKTLCDLEMQPEIQDMFIQGLTDYIQLKCNKEYSIYSSLLLDINMTCYKGEFLKKLTINMGQLLLLDVDTGNDVEKIIYRCFCIVRHENKETDFAKYKVHFTFISTMDAEEKMLKMSNLRSFLLMLILLMISSGSQHKSAKLKKYLSLKYAYEDAILYLLWCSGDVEINPGPTRTKLEEQAIAIKKRNWIYDMCTITLKLLKNKALDSKFDGLWKEKPDSWQELHADQPFYDPRKKQKSKQFSIKTDEELLNCLLKCCDWKSITLPSNFQREIDAWKSDTVLLLELFVTRREINSMKKAKELLIMYRDTAELKQHLKNCNVCISFNPNNTHVGHSKGYSDIIRKLAITFCRISNGLPILVKRDGIWKTKPHDWNPNDLYYDPCNTGKRQEKHQDQKLVDNLLFYCERKSISIPSELQLVVKAWKLKNSKEISKCYTIWSCMAIIQHSLKYLELEGLLEKTHVQQSLKQIGVSLHCEKGPNQLNNDSTINTDDERTVSGLPNNSLSDNQRCTHWSFPLCSASDSDIVCSQHPYEAKALTNSHTTISVITCQKHNFINQPSTSGCTIYSKTAPCQRNRVDLQSRGERLDLSDSHTSLSEISCQKPDFQLSSSGCSSFTKRAQCLKVSDELPSKDGKIQKRKRAISEERSEKRSGLQFGNESQASTSSITRSNGDTTPSSHCDVDMADHNVNKKEDLEQDLSSNRIPIPANQIQDTDSSNELFGSEDEIPNHLLEYIDTYMSCDNLEEELEHIDRQLKLWETL